ncbi:MAG: hypothetical protein WCI20_03485 [bacterium]
MNHKRLGTTIFATALLAGLLAAKLSAADPPPHPGEPLAHQALVSGAESTPARLYAREHPEGPPRVEPVYVKAARTDHWEITLPKLHPAGAV